MRPLRQRVQTANGTFLLHEGDLFKGSCDLRYLELPTVRACARECSHQGACSAFVLFSGSCYLKSCAIQKHPPDQCCPGAISGWRAPSASMVSTNDHLNAWDLMFSCPHVRHSYRCSGPQFQDFLHSLPPLSRWELQPPPGIRLLFYGPSYLNELMQSTICANKVTWATDMRAEPETATYLAKGIERAPAQPCVKGVCQGTDFLRYTFANRAQITAISNYGPLQHSTSYPALRSFLRSNDFDAIAYMPPHPDEHFRHVWVQLGALPSQDTLAKHHAIARIFSKEGRAGCVFQVGHWWAKLRKDSEYIGFNRHLNFSVVETHDILRQYKCDHPHCDVDGLDTAHQCVPGNPTLMAARLLNAIKEKRCFPLTEL